MSTRLPEDIVPDNDQTRARREHLEKIQALVGNAYPNRFDRSGLTESDEREDTITSVVAAYGKYEPEVKEGGRPTPEQLQEASAEMGEPVVRISGRLATPPRVMGKAAFVHLSDGEGRLQIYVRRQDARAVSNDSLQPVEEEESGWKLFQLLDHGDFVGVEGKLFVTKTGELSVHVETIQFLAKALLPMPDKLHGISDPEVRQRQRYADLIASSLKVRADEEDEGSRHELSTREVFVRRSKLVTALRRHLDDHGYIEVETPMLSPIASGAAAKPFETFHKALGIPLYLRIAPELYLKRLLVGGFERVYELNRNFRNEGISARHNPEFTMLEFYTAYKDVNWMMDFCEEMLRASIEKVKGSLQVTISEEVVDLSEFQVKTRERTIDFSQFERLSMRDAIAKYWNDSFTKIHRPLHHRPSSIEVMTRGVFDRSWLDDIEQLYYLATICEAPHLTPYFFQGEIPVTPVQFEGSVETDRTRIAEKLTQVYKKGFDENSKDSEEVRAQKLTIKIFETRVEPLLTQPTFIIDFPKVVSPLSKASPDDPTIAERFELYVAGMEVANGFSELNDPAEQLERFEEQSRQREGGDEEAMQTDLDYVRALSYGMPPAAGIGIGIDRLTMLLTNRRSIRDVILFPHMRPRQTSEEQAQADEKQASDS